jgi:hypothetical protein
MTLTMILIGELLLTAPMAVRRDVAVPVDRATVAPEARAAAPIRVEPLNRIEQLTNPRTGTTCTMQILRARPLDARAVVPAAPAQVDPGIGARGVSPCLD